jgi:low temperature requirement protein LtrA
VIAHPGGHASVATTTTVLLGPALFLAGHALFKRVVFGRLSVPRLLAIVALAGLWPVGPAVSPLLLALVATLVVAAVAVSDTRTARAPTPSPAGDAPLG